MRDQHPVDALCDLLLEEGLQTSYTALSGDAMSLARFVAHPLSVVAFDPMRVDAPATRANPRQQAVGIEHVFVNGAHVVDSGQDTGAVAGRALRRGRD
jgi:N-acyl-D-aspartate/D-glutamate deacylase